MPNERDGGQTAGLGDRGPAGAEPARGNRLPGAARNRFIVGWFRALDSFLERAFLEADRATGC